MKRESRRTILIYCEGESEYAYFKSLEEQITLAIGKANSPILDIYPIPESKENPTSAAKSGRPSRKTKPAPSAPIEYAPPDDAEINFWEKLNIGRRYSDRNPKDPSGWQQPTNYVKLARDKIKETAPAEAWVVFDADGHPKIKEAFDFAAMEVEGITISVAFSKLSFEYWKLLHFEFAAEGFRYTQHHTSTPPNSHGWPGRNGKREGYLVPCGQSQNGSEGYDCKGDPEFRSSNYPSDRTGPCLVGRLRQKAYLPNYQKSANSADCAILVSSTQAAINRAEILRAKLQAEHGDKPPYEYPFFTNLDALVLSIAHGHPDWRASREVFYIQDSAPIITSHGIEITPGLVDNQPVLRIKNNGTQSVLAREFICLDNAGIPIDHGFESLIEQGSSAQITLPSPHIGNLCIVKYKSALFAVAIDQL